MHLKLLSLPEVRNAFFIITYKIGIGRKHCSINGPDGGLRHLIQTITSPVDYGPQDTDQYSLTPHRQGSADLLPHTAGTPPGSVRSIVSGKERVDAWVANANSTS